GWLTWTVVLFAFARRSGRFWPDLGRLAKCYGGPLLVGLAFALVAISVFFPEQFIQCLNEDGT
ncbi:MAG: hypothetical protein GTN77_10520, partial [Planctomycetales bacterium]|nr:hypothetical protein [Planctomycetales bacterium]